MKRDRLYGIAGLLLCGMLLCATPGVKADTIVVQPLFEYPTAPEEMEDLTDRSDYLMEHFWDAMDFTRQDALDQNALNHAFSVYASAMPFASRDAVLKSVSDIIGKVKDNPILLIQFTKSAEETLYGPRADMWSDEIYSPFLKAYLGCKGISETRKMRYRNQSDKINGTARGKKAPAFRYRIRNGQYRDFKPEAHYTLIEFGEPGCDDCRFARLKLEMASDLTDMIEAKKVQMMFIVPDVAPDEEKETLDKLQDYPVGWTAAIGYGIDDKYDIRNVPSFYVLGPKGVIEGKNLDVSRALELLRELTASKK